MMETGTTIVIVVVMMDGVIMMDGVEGVVVDGGRVPMSTFTLGRLTPPTDTMRILPNMGITDTQRVLQWIKGLRDGSIPRGLSGCKVTL